MWASSNRSPGDRVEAGSWAGTDEAETRTPGGATTGLTVTAFDLDGTLIYSTASAGDPGAHGPLCVVEMFDGAPLSRMTRNAWHTLSRVIDEAEFVPVTTRTQAQYERVQFPHPPRYALCANGGVLLINGVRDPDWDTWVRTICALSAPVDDVAAILFEVAGHPWVKNVRVAEDLFVYLVADSRPAIPDEWLTRCTERVTALGWTISVQGRKVYAVPEALSKAAALARLRTLLERATHPGGVRVYATGDSLLNGPMMAGADAAIRPAHGELHEQGWVVNGVQVTEHSGALAGEEILAWMLHKATTS